MFREDFHPEVSVVQFQVPPDGGGITLGRYLYDRLGLSRTFVRRAKNADGLLVDGAPVRVSHVLQGGERIDAVVDEEARVAPEQIPLTVVFEDDQVLVVDKPAGMVVHPVKDYTGGTLANAVAGHLLGQGESGVTRPVLRIDRDTSGLVLFAKNPVAAQRLAKALEQHKPERHYIAFVSGQVVDPEGTVTVPLRRVWGHPVAREAAVGLRTPEQEELLRSAEAGGQMLRAEWKAGGQLAVTHFRVIERWSGATMLSLALETGRTHQIRVHLAYLGHPLLGDGLYGSSGPPGRQALHAATLVFAHPATGEVLRLNSPLPEDLRRLQQSLRAGE